VELRWQWRLANGGRVTAVIEAGVEVISQGERVLSRAARGSLPEGHRVLVTPDMQPGTSERPPIEAVVTFAQNAPVCVLRVDDQEIAPLAWPVRARVADPPPKPRLGWLYALAGLALLAILVTVVRSRSETPSTAPGLGRTYRCPNGLFVAHYPEDFDATVAVLPAAVSGVVLADKAKTSAILIATAPGSRDPWSLQQRLHAEALANMPTDGTYAEVGRGEGPCVGRPGAIVIGRILRGGKPTARIWTCAFANENAGYFAMTTLPEPVSDDVERGARVVVERTELTKLADLSQ
jgi:hypothetical protein